MSENFFHHDEKKYFFSRIISNWSKMSLGVILEPQVRIFQYNPAQKWLKLKFQSHRNSIQKIMKIIKFFLTFFVSYCRALRVSAAETRLTVYRRLSVRNKGGKKWSMRNIWPFKCSENLKFPVFILDWGLDTLKIWIWFQKVWVIAAESPNMSDKKNH